MQLRLLRRADVIAAGGEEVAAAMDDIRTALAALRDGRAEMPPETSVRLGAEGAPQARVYALPARVGGHAGVKWTAHRPAGQTPATASFTIVNDAVTGLPIGLVESASLTATRTAAASAFMLMARPPRRVALPRRRGTSRRPICGCLLNCSRAYTASRSGTVRRPEPRLSPAFPQRSPSWPPPTSARPWTARTR